MSLDRGRIVARRWESWFGPRSYENLMPELAHEPAFDLALLTPRQVALGEMARCILRHA